MKNLPYSVGLNKAVFPESIKYPIQYGSNILASEITAKTTSLYSMIYYMNFLMILCEQKYVMLS